MNVGQILKVERPYYEQEQLNDELKYCKPKHNVGKLLLSKFKNIKPSKCFLSTFPIFSWLQQYDLKRNLFGDIISGFTVAVMHIPQGMGYALLANVPPIVGIYMAFFPVLVYCIFGTSRHNSMGTFAVVSIMIGKTITTMSQSQSNTILPSSSSAMIIDGRPPPNNYSNNNIASASMASHLIDGDIIETLQYQQYTPLQIATIVCFTVGLIQSIMYIFRLGIISTLLSETLVSGFTTGAGVHVLTSQLKYVFGLEIAPESGVFKLVFDYIKMFKQITSLNVITTVISIVTITVIYINNEYLKSIISKKCSMPIPIELIMVVGGTLLSKYCELDKNWNVKTIGYIPTGFPALEIPKFELLTSVAVDSFTIAMVSYTVSVSMALIFAQRLNYEIDFNQELLAMGAGNIFASFFSCLPFSASLSRSSIQEAVGGHTQIASIISCGLLTIVLLWVGPFFEPLPICVLASIIIVALKSMLMQIRNIAGFWKLSRLDAIVWIITFLTVVVVAIDIGLLVGIILSLACIFIRGMKPYTCLLGNVPRTDLYLDIKRYKGAEEIDTIKIFHYCGSINFASRNSFKFELCKLIQLDLPKELRRLNKIKAKELLLKNGNGNGNGRANGGGGGQASKKYDRINFKYLIIDFSALSYVDPSGVTFLKHLIADFQKLSITLYIAGTSCPTYEMMKKCDLKESPNDPSFKYFPTVHDAVHHAMENSPPISIIVN